MHAPDAPARPGFAPWLGGANAITKGFLAAGPEVINMAGGLPPAEVLPAEELAPLAEAAIRAHPGDCLGYGPVEGLLPLRQALAARFSTGGLRLGPEHVLVTTSGMQGLDLIGKALIAPGQLVAAQAPAYLGALDAWRPRAPRLRPMRLEGPGFDPVAALEGAQFGYVVPNFSNPTGRLVGLAQRRALVAAAEATGVWLVEDDPYGGLQYDGPALPRMIELAGRGRAYDGPVVYMGTLSKELVPGLRVGWVVGAPELIAALAQAKMGSDMCSPGLSQRLALAALEAGVMERLQPRLVALYRARRDALLAAMAEHLGSRFAWEAPAGGMFVWAVARDPWMDTDALAMRAVAAGVMVSPSSVFDPEGRDRSAIRINFTLNPPERLAEGVRRLAVALAG